MPHEQFDVGVLRAEVWVFSPQNFENCRSPRERRSHRRRLLCAASSEAAAYSPRRGREAGAAGVRSEGDHDHDEKRELMTALTESFLRWVYFWPTPMNMMGWPVL